MDLTKIYGIEFDEAVLRGGEKRICDAAGLENDYVVGQAFQKHSGKNDFDNTQNLSFTYFKNSLSLESSQKFNC